jgi:hypothetical protein
VSEHEVLFCMVSFIAVAVTAFVMGVYVGKEDK